MRGKRNLFQPEDKFGNLTIVKRWTEKPEGRKSKETFCECLCECGNNVIVPARYLANGHKLSCGCLQKKNNKEHHAWKGHGEIGGSWWHDLKKGCKRKSRTILFDLTIESAWELFLSQNRKCAISGIDIGFSTKARRYDRTGTASLDRIDSSGAYTIDNVQWVHKIVNNMKQAMNQSDFIGWCKAIAANSAIVP